MTRRSVHDPAAPNPRGTKACDGHRLVGTPRGRPRIWKGGRRVYFTDRGIEELAERRGSETVTLEWLSERLRDFLDENPEFEVPVERFATWLARLDEDDE